MQVDGLKPRLLYVQVTIWLAREAMVTSPYVPVAPPRNMKYAAPQRQRPAQR